MVRIITGTAKGRRLSSVPGYDKRPTSDRTKESIFSILGNTICSVDVLDLFAGTGNLGIEALSRGARSVVFVDEDRACQETIESNLELTGLRGQAEIWRCDAFAALRRLNIEQRKFDIIFADPPYGDACGGRLLDVISDSTLLHTDGIFVLEHSAGEELPLPHRPVHMLSERRYGRTSVHFFQYTSQKE